ncbi:hypothetical protein [Plantactinospora soyae]|uniref:Uncharacterized protein n=1 Tax=Plantactinospora soyae TaxID=1544732 RepID=A0A927M7I8_9ACTN|nr:hypothetical protein [Plantactinospora soyae]MBE1485935.1 hypothetical protein [Plantactinospora soyae]
MGQPDEDFAPGDHLTPDERDPEAPPADAVEQATVADPTTEEQSDVQRGPEVNEADAIEQAQVVGPEDDYR